MGKSYYYVFKEGSTINQITCAVLINLPVFAYGASIGWMSPMTLLLQSKNTPRDTPLTDTEVSWMAAVAYIVCVPADFLIAYLADTIGRKLTMLGISLTTTCIWIIKLSSMDTWAFILARALVGVSMAGAYVACPLYTKEISQDSIRGVLGSLVILFHTVGNLFMYIIGDILSYRVILWICLALPTVHLAFFLMMPESPSYLLKKGKVEQATRVLAWLRCRSEDDVLVRSELNRLQNEQDKDEETSSVVFKAIYKILFRAFCISMFVSLAREVCGAIPVLNFAGDIFAMTSQGSGIFLTPNQQAMMLGVVQVVAASLGSGLVEKIGRRPLLFGTSLVSGISMCALASWFLARACGVLAPDWLPVASLCVCIFCDSVGLQPVSVVIIGEIFSFKYRGTVMAASMAAGALVDFFQLLFFKALANAVGIHVSFYFFGGVCILAAIYVILVIPETKNRSLDVIYDMLKTKKERKMENMTSDKKMELNIL